jgi:protein transport protein SEC13
MSAAARFDVAAVGDPNDLAVDSLGRHVAVGSEQGRILVADAPTGTTIACFQAHQQPILRVAWAHHRFGRILLSSTDVGLTIWALQAGKNELTPVYTLDVIAGCRSAVWAPSEFGAMIAVARGDGHVLILSSKAPDLAAWEMTSFMAHDGVVGVSWSPCLAPGTLLHMPLGVPQQNAAQQQPAITIPSPRIVTCGSDRTVRIWRYLAQDRHWLQEQDLSSDLPPAVTCVHDVAWAPNPGLPFGYIAAGTEEGLVTIWLQDGCDGRWNSLTMPDRFAAPVCRVGWSSAGSLLHINCADGMHTVWKENASGEWSCLLSE